MDETVGGGSAVLDRVRGASLDAALEFAAATAASRLAEFGLRRRAGRVVFVPFAVRVVVDPSGFFIFSRRQREEETAMGIRNALGSHPPRVSSSA